MDQNTLINAWFTVIFLVRIFSRNVIIVPRFDLKRKQVILTMWYIVAVTEGKFINTFVKSGLSNPYCFIGPFSFIGE